MTRRIVAIVLVVVGVTLTAVGVAARLLAPDEGHHDGRTPTFALQSSIGDDTLEVDPVAGRAAVDVSVRRSGERITEFGTVHGVPLDAFAVSSDLTQFVHHDRSMDQGTGVGRLDLPGGGDYRVIVQTGPKDGPDLLELGRSVTVDGPPAAADPSIVDGDVWTADGLTITRQGLDFVLSEPFAGDDYRDGAALLTMFHEGDLAFAHAHASVVDGTRLRFALDLPGRGDYLAALQLHRAGSDDLVTALFRVQI